MSCNWFDNDMIDIVGLCDVDKFEFNPCDPESLSWTQISIPEVLHVPHSKPDIESIEKVLIDVKIISKRVIKTPESNNNGCNNLNIPDIPPLYADERNCNIECECVSSQDPDCNCTLPLTGANCQCPVDLDCGPGDDGEECPTENAEGTKLTGRKLIVEGVLNQKIIYTADVPTQNVHSAHFNVPFSAFIVIPKCIRVPKNCTRPSGRELTICEYIDSLNFEFCVETCIEDVFVKAFNKREIFKNVTLFLRALPIKTCDCTNG